MQKDCRYGFRLLLQLISEVRYSLLMISLAAAVRALVRVPASLSAALGSSLSHSRAMTETRELAVGGLGRGKLCAPVLLHPRSMPASHCRSHGPSPPPNWCSSRTTQCLVVVSAGRGPGLLSVDAVLLFFLLLLLWEGGARKPDEHLTCSLIFPMSFCA